MNYGFAFSVDYGPRRLEEARPVVVLIWQGESKPQDASAYAQALQPGQILRVAADSHGLLAGLEAWCGNHGLRVVTTTEDRALTIYGCYAHYYIDMQRADTISARP
jgi:hypothetical protein